MTAIPDPNNPNVAILANGTLGTAVYWVPNYPDPKGPTRDDLNQGTIIGYVHHPTGPQITGSPDNDH